MGYFLTHIARISVNTLLSVGAHLTISVGNIFFLGFPVSYALGAYALTISQKHGAGFSLSVIIALLFVFLSGILFSIMYLKLSHDSFTVFTLVSILAFDALLKSWTSVTGGVLGIAGVTRPEIISTLGSLVILGVVIMIGTLFFEYVLLNSWIGRALMGMKEDVSLVESLGFPTKKIGFAIIVVACLFAGVGGILGIWRIQFLSPDFGGIMLLIQIVTIAIIASKPKVRWLAVSILFITLLPEVIRLLDLPSSVIGHLRSLIYSILLIVIIRRLSKTALPQKRFI